MSRLWFTLFYLVSRRFSLSQIREWNYQANHSFAVQPTRWIWSSLLCKNNVKLFTERNLHFCMCYLLSASSCLREAFELGLARVLRITVEGRDCPSIHAQETGKVISNSRRPSGKTLSCCWSRNSNTAVRFNVGYFGVFDASNLQHGAKPHGWRDGS